MGAVVIGSRGLKKLFPDFPRDPKDWDFFAESHYVKSDFLEGDDIFQHPLLDPWLESLGFPGRDLTLDELYTIKVSHSYWELKNGSWDKHMSDILFMQSKGAKLDMDLHKLLYSVWEDVHGKKKMDLTKEAAGFFKDAVVRIYDHDSIHASVAYFDEPLYTRILRDGHSVDVDPQKMWALPFDLQLKLFREEIYATALERKVIPSNYRCSPRAAYHWALKRTITSLTKGKSARFLVENYGVFRKPDIDYVSHHRKNSHRLIPLEAGQTVSMSMM